MSSLLSLACRKWFRSTLGLFALIFALMSSDARAQQVVISQIYGGGGNVGATFNRDFVELHNRGSTSVAIAGWSIQYAASTGSSWSSTTQQVRLTGAAPIPAGGYFLVATTTSGTVGRRDHRGLPRDGGQPGRHERDRRQGRVGQQLDADLGRALGVAAHVLAGADGDARHRGLRRVRVP